QHFIQADFEFVYDDDDAGEAADLICIKEEANHIRLVLAHCKFSGNAQAGERVKDVVEVASQAIRSVRWPGNFKGLLEHIICRERRHKSTARSGYIQGNSAVLTRFGRLERYKEI